MKDNPAMRAMMIWVAGERDMVLEVMLLMVLIKKVVCIGQIFNRWSEIEYPFQCMRYLWDLPFPLCGRMPSTSNSSSPSIISGGGSSSEDPWTSFSL